MLDQGDKFHLLSGPDLQDSTKRDYQNQIHDNTEIMSVKLLTPHTHINGQSAEKYHCMRIQKPFEQSVNLIIITERKRMELPIIYKHTHT